MTRTLAPQVSVSARVRVLVAVCGCLAMAAGTAPCRAQAPTRSTLDGVYSEPQAAAGREVYQRACVACHALDWYTGDAVRGWNGASLDQLVDLLGTTMPQDNPGSLRRREYVALLAYILSLNALPAGDEPLSTGRSRLATIRFTLDEVDP